MATNTNQSSNLTTSQTQRLGGTTLNKSKKYNFRIQSAPPLSIQQFLRTATGVVVGTKQWQPSGRYRAPIFNAYLSPAVKEKPKPVELLWRPPSAYKEKRLTSLSPEKKLEKRIEEPVWHAPGRYVDKRPSSLSPEKKVQKSITEPVWRPAGKTEHTPVPYFDPPNLRWSLQELLRSMPDMRPKTFRASSSMSNLRKSEVIGDT